MKITVFTATYNRANLLSDLYKSLKRQTNQDFEWLVVDDGSLDRTEEFLQRWVNDEHKFILRYFIQPHGGKHRALNRAFELAQGEYFFIVDSDDYLADDALEKIDSWIATIEGIPGFAGVSGMCADKYGKIVGGKGKFLSKQYIDATNLEREKYLLSGDKAEVYNTKILRRNPFPEFEGEDFITEAVCWDKIAQEKLKIRWFPDIIYYCDYKEDGLTRQGANDIAGHLKNYQGYCYYVRQVIHVCGFMDRCRVIRDFFRTGKKQKKNIRDLSNDLGIPLYKFVFEFLKMPIFYAIRFNDKIIRRRK